MEALTTTESTRCELTTKNGGRCGRSVRSEEHHIKYRSHGGGNEADNIVRLCPDHHAAIHRTRKPFLDGPYKTSGDRTYYTEDVGGEDKVEKARWYFWRDVSEQFETEENKIHSHLMELRERIEFDRTTIAYLCAEVDARGLYALRGYDTGVDYMMGELGVAEASARNALRVGEFLRVNPHLLKKIQADGLYFTTLRDSLTALKQLPGDKVEAVVDEMIAAQNDDVPRDAIVNSVKEAAGTDSPGNEYRVTANLKLLSRRLTLELSAPNPEGARSAFLRKLGLLGPLALALEAQIDRVRKV